MFKILFVFVLGPILMSKSILAENKVDLTVIFPHIHYEKQWDIAHSSSLWSYFINNNIVESLIRLDSRTNYFPAIASSWFLSKDSKTITFSLDQNYFFHNGDRVKPVDINSSFLRVLKLKTTSHSDLTSSMCSVEECERNVLLSDNQLTIKLKKPVNGLLFNIASPEYGIVPSSYYLSSSVDKEDLKNLTGPYQLLDFNKEHLILRAFSKHPYFSESNPQIVKIKEITNFEEAISYYNNHENSVLIGSDYFSSKKLKSLNGQKFISSFSLTEFIVPNLRSKVWGEKFSLEMLNSFIQEIKPRLDLDTELIEYTEQIFTRDNIARLEEVERSKVACNPFKGPITLKMILFDWMKDSPVPYKLKELLLKFNVLLDIQIKGVSDLNEVVTKRDYDLIYIYSGVSAKDPIIELIYLSQHPLIDLKYKNEFLEDNLDKAKSETDREEYIKLIKATHESILNDRRIIPLFHTRMVYLTNSKYKIKDMNYFDGGLDLWTWKK